MSSANKEIENRIKRIHAFDSTRPAENLRDPFWSLVQAIQTLADSFPHVGLYEALDHAMEYVEIEDMYNRAEASPYEHF